jgi:hypothetical protein
MSIFKKAISNEASHIKNRVKMSGAITIQEENAVNSCILSPNSEELNEIEKLFKDIIKNKRKIKIENNNSFIRQVFLVPSF